MSPSGVLPGAVICPNGHLHHNLRLALFLALTSDALVHLISVLIRHHLLSVCGSVFLQLQVSSSRDIFACIRARSWNTRRSIYTKKSRMVSLCGIYFSKTVGPSELIIGVHMYVHLCHCFRWVSFPFSLHGNEQIYLLHNLISLTSYHHSDFRTFPNANRKSHIHSVTNQNFPLSLVCKWASLYSSQRSLHGQ